MVTHGFTRPHEEPRPAEGGPESARVSQPLKAPARPAPLHPAPVPNPERGPDQRLRGRSSFGLAPGARHLGRVRQPDADRKHTPFSGNIADRDVAAIRVCCLAGK